MSVQRLKTGYSRIVSESFILRKYVDGNNDSTWISTTASLVALPWRTALTDWTRDAHSDFFSVQSCKKEESLAVAFFILFCNATSVIPNQGAALRCQSCRQIWKNCLFIDVLLGCSPFLVKSQVELSRKQQCDQN